MTKYLFIILLGICISCNHSKEGKVQSHTKSESTMVFAAASLSDVLSEITVAFEGKYGVKVKMNLASSGQLARQIEQGGVPDVYISANKKWADYLEDEGLLIDKTKSEVAQNALVLIAPINSNLAEQTIDSTLRWDAILGDERLSIGDPAHVPAGIYAKQSLEYFGWYQHLEDKILPAKDVRSALMVVEMEEVPAGIVYRTDAQKSKKVKILGVFPEDSHESIVYVAGMCKDDQMAQNFLEFLSSKESKSLWEKYGFIKEKISN